MADRYLVEPQYGESYSISRVEAESRWVDLLEAEAEVKGDLEAGFEYRPPWPSYAGLVRVVPMTGNADGSVNAS